VSPPKSILLSLKNVYETLYVSAPTMLDAIRGNVTKEACDDRLESWASRVVSNSEMIVSVHGREHVPPVRSGGRSYLVMSNHQSHYDIAIIYYVLGSSVRMVAKRELFDLPIFGSALRASGMISIDRGNKESAIASLEEAKAKLSDGIPIWMAPEGTRSPTGKLMPFKKGGFVLAMRTGVPIMPVTIRGTRDVLRAKGMRSRRGVEVTVTIHPMIDPKRFADMEFTEGRDALSQAVRRAIESGL
jgi:1-acyl-sn-glycerol-3-phosphate acyltransferase